MAFLWFIGIFVIAAGLIQFGIYVYQLRRDLRIVTQQNDERSSVIVELRKINGEHLTKQYDILKSSLPKEIENSASTARSVRVDVYHARHPKSWSSYSTPKEMVTASLSPENVVFRGSQNIIWKTQDPNVFVRHYFNIEYQYRCSSPNPYAYGLNDIYWAISKEDFDLNWAKKEIKLTEI